MSYEDFSKQCGSPIIVYGYALHEHQTHPDTYDELLEFISDRLKIDELPFSVEALSRWVMHRRAGEEDSVDCLDMNVEHASAVLLIGELPDPDEYVASLPDVEGMIVLPPLAIVHKMLHD